MSRVNFVFLFFLWTLVFIIFYPVFSAEYLYSDEANQLWYASKKINFQTSVPQGRYLTYKIFEWVFAYIHNIHNVIYARLFSLFGWLLFLPVWLFIINKVAIQNKLPKSLVFLSMIYLVTMPPFIIYIGWSACMEMFIACTSALMAGYTLYDGLQYHGDRIQLSTSRIILSLVLGIIALFIYQNCFGCFFIPFFIHFIAVKKFTRKIYIGFVFSLVIFVVYYFIFKYTLNTYAVEASSRSSFATNPINKLLFLFARPLSTAFNFTFIFTEKSITGLIVYLIIAVSWLLIYLVIPKNKSISQKLTYLLSLLAFAILVYLPSLIVQENYSSHRTLFALNLMVFLLVAETFLSLIKKDKLKNIIAALTGVFFLINAWYNYHKQFLNPLTREYALVKKLIDEHYQTGITAIYFICATENAFKEKYGITLSWDEFGVPSTAKIWVPEPLLKQLIFEKTGNHQTAEKIIVKSWASKEAFEKSGEIVLKDMLFINMQEILTK